MACLRAKLGKGCRLRLQSGEQPGKWRKRGLNRTLAGGDRELQGKGIICFVFFSCALALSRSVEFDEGYNVGGSIEYRFIEGGKVMLAETNQFDVRVRGCHSEIETPGIPTGVGMEVRSHRYTSDGRTCFFVTELAPRPTTGAAARLDDGRLGTKQGNRAEVLVHAFADMRPDAFPPDHAGFVSVAWLAYASSCTLGEEGVGKAPPLVFMGPRWDQYGHRLKCTWSSSRAAPHLPEYMVEYADEKVFNFTEEAMTILQKPSFPPLYSQGYTNAIYEVLTWTNLGDLRLPLHFRFSRFIPRVGGVRTNDLDLQLLYDGWASAVSTNRLGEMTLPRSFPQLTRISDYRLGSADDPPIIYMSGKGQVPTLDEAKRIRAGTQARSLPLRAVVRVVLAVLVVSPAFLWLLCRWRKSQQRGPKTPH